MRLARRATTAAGGAIALLIWLGRSGPVAHADVILHEYFRPDPSEDLELSATTPDGSMSAAIQTQSGAVGAPSLDGPEPLGGVYGGDRSGARPGGAERLDNDTTQPDALDYTDPFTPEIMPFKREFAFDMVRDSFELGVADVTLAAVEVGGTAGPDDDQFYADMQVDLSRSEPVRIPSVGPGARVLALRTHPATHVEIVRDGADNWFLKSTKDGRVRVTMQVAIDRAVFGSEFGNVAWSRLARYVPPLPPDVRDAGRRVADVVGVTSAMSPRAALRLLVGHFRDFAPSADRPDASGGRLFEEIALSKKGVCRHRSFGFVVTALSIGLPARFVRNEAHAWIEVFDATRWHRIDLGGAAGRVDAELGDRPPHIVPRDPYVWPPGSDSGAAVADRARERAGARAAAANQTGAGPTPLGPGGPRVASPQLLELYDASPSEVTLAVDASSAVRGGYLPVRGAVTSDDAPCAFVRVDFVLRPREASGRTQDIRLGTLFTNADGRYEHRVVIPFDMDVGDYDVVASTPGGYGCGPGRTE